MLLLHACEDLGGYHLPESKVGASFAAASGVGSPGRLPASPRSPTPPVAALLSPHRTGGWGGLWSLQRPRPLAFSFFPGFGILLPEPGEVLPRAALSEETRAQASAAAREPSWAQDIPSSASGARRLGWDWALRKVSLMSL